MKCRERKDKGHGKQDKQPHNEGEKWMDESTGKGGQKEIQRLSGLRNHPCEASPLLKDEQINPTVGDRYRTKLGSLS